MNKIPLIIKREYLTRVKKKSFIIMTIVGPILMAALFIAPVWFATMDDDAVKVIEVYDKTGTYKDAFENSETITFQFIKEDNDSIRKSDFLLSGNYALLTILDTAGNEFSLYSGKSPDLDVKEQICSKLERFMEEMNFNRLGIKKEDIESAKVDITLNTYTITEEGEEKSSAELTVAIGFIAAIIIYMFIFMYGVQVMRGVIEEKVNRVVEVLISSVKPFQLMAGKIIGIAGVALTQFLLWAILTGIIVGFVYLAFGSSMMQQNVDISQIQQLSPEQAQQMIGNSMIADILAVVMNFNWATMITTFIFFFIGGYLLYASLFAAIGSAVDNETDTQQFMLPVTIPLIIAFVAAQGIIRNPDGALAFWLSVIPFTSPIIMPVRVAMERYETWELILSIVTLILTFIGSVWFAAKIYKTGILMYGKKVSYKELWKWLRYK
ncbi:MAG: ABC transporter permease [Bacteroidales bacterium]|nr:ABC transporter permease [Bacteroidales bacterium]